MEKAHRLFLRNLPPDIDDNTLRKLFENYGKVTNVDIKEKMQNDGSKIAFVNVACTERDLLSFFQAVNTLILGGNAISVEVAKESFLDRLKREREAAAKCKEPTKEVKIFRDMPIEKISFKLPGNIKTVATKRIFNFDEFDDSQTVDDGLVNNAGKFDYDSALRVEEFEEQLLSKKSLKVERPKMIDQKKETRIAEKQVLSESEIKRLASMQQKRQAFRAKGQMISNALKAVDSSRNNKIIFAEDIDEISPTVDNKKKSLFCDDDEAGDEVDWGEDKFEHDEKRSAKLAMSLKNLGGDKRFTLDDRFLDDPEDSPEGKVAVTDDDEMKNEAKWSLGILQTVLGKPLKARDELNLKKQNKMVRYDPTVIGHRAHELEIQVNVSSKAKKVKLAVKALEPEVQAPFPVSSDIFYSVSDTLTGSLKNQEEFSLLKTFGKAAPAEKNSSTDYIANAKLAQEAGQWGRNFDTKNPFKYESSDDEGPEPSMDQVKSKPSKATLSLERNDETFFAVNFPVGVEFFNTLPALSGEFKDVRRELKQVVRSKIRNNVKKSTPWRNKKIGTKSKVW